MMSAKIWYIAWILRIVWNNPTLNLVSEAQSMMFSEFPDVNIEFLSVFM